MPVKKHQVISSHQFKVISIVAIEMIFYPKKLQFRLGRAFIFLSLSLFLLVSIIMYRNNVYFNLIFVILSQNKRTSIKRTKSFCPTDVR